MDNQNVNEPYESSFEAQASGNARPEKKHLPGTKRAFFSGLFAGILVCVIAGGALMVNGMPALFQMGRQMLRRGSGTSAVNDASIEKLMTLEEAIREYYYQPEELDTAKFEEGLYKGLFEAIGDPYSVYYTAEESRQLDEALSGKFGGIGAYISLDQVSGYPKIAGVMRGTPAEAAGVMEDDIIYEVDGENCMGLDLDTVVSHVRGDPGTKVVLTIVRSGEPDYLEIEVTRDIIETETVAWEMEEGNIGFIELASFDSVSTDQFRKAMEELTSQGMRGLVLDLRANPGGDVDVACAIASELLPEGLIFYMEDRDGKRTEYKCDGKNAIQIPLVVLVNGNSASAAEILSGAIQDAGVGTIMGTQTYGKGIVQQVYSLQDGSAFKITTQHYYTRGGNDIHKVGITPDITLEFDRDAYLEDGTDNQFESAVKEVRRALGDEVEEEAPAEEDDAA